MYLEKLKKFKERAYESLSEHAKMFLDAATGVNSTGDPDMEEFCKESEELADLFVRVHKKEIEDKGWTEGNLPLKNHIKTSLTKTS